MSERTQLSAVVFGDLVGYSRLVNNDEAGTLAFVAEVFDEVAALLPGFSGDLVKTTGDGFLILFPAASQAVAFSLEFHRKIAALQDQEHQRYWFRIGIHSGEVRRDDTDTYGHAVNIAARLEPLAEPGGVLVSADVYRQARQSEICDFETAGVPVLKNIKDRVPTFRVVPKREMGGDANLEALRINVLGGLRLEAEEGPIRLRNDTRVRDLIGCLVLSRNLSETKARLAALLWPDTEPRKAAKLMRKTWEEGRKVLAFGSNSALVQDPERMSLDQSCLEVDVHMIHEDLKRGRISDQLLEGIDWEREVLPSFDSTNAMLKSWIAVTRRRWRDTYTRALEGVLEGASPQEEVARRSAMALISLEPGHEPASKVLMSHYIAQGNRVAALREYERLSGYLDENFGLAPSSDVEELRQSVQSKKASAKSPKQKTSASKLEPAGKVTDAIHTARRLRITVGAFDGGAMDDPHLLMGFRAELTANLARFREWVVTDDEGGGTDNTVLEAVPDFHGYTLRASARQEVDAASLKIALRDDLNGRVVWTETIRLTLSDWTRTQKIVIGKIAATLEVYVSADRMAFAIAAPETAQDSFDAWLRGEMLLTRWTVDADDEAAGIFAKVIEADPSFASAYASLASIHNVIHVVRPGYVRRADETKKALLLGRQAVELDPIDARNQLAVAWTAALAGYYDQALIHTDMAVQLNRNSPRTTISAAMGYAFFGDQYKSMVLLQEVMEIGPMIPDYLWCYIATCLYFAGDNKAGIAAATRSGNSIVDNYGWSALLLHKMGRREDAAAAIDKLVSDVSTIWCGEGTADRNGVLDWFTSMYPIRDETAKAEIKAILSEYRA